MERRRGEQTVWWPRKCPNGKEDAQGPRGPALTACTGAAMSRWTQTPGQSKPMCEAMKRPAQELGLLSRSWGDGRSDGVGEGLHPERPQGCCCSALGEHAGPRPAPAPSATAFLGICRKAVVGEGQCPLGTQLRGTWDPEGLARGLTGLPSPRRATGKGAEGSRQTPRWGGTPEPGAVGMLAPLPLAPVDTCPGTDLGPRGGPCSAPLLFLGSH